MIDRSRPLPVHAQVYDELQALIERGELQPGARLPSDVALADRFAVNRLTVRQALADLARAGLVVPRQGVGTFVAQRMEPFEVEIAASDWAVEHERSAKAAADAGRPLTETLLHAEHVESPRTVVEHLGRGRLLRLESAVHVDGEPTIRSQYWTRSSWTVEQVRAAADRGFGLTVIRDVVGHDMYYAWRSFDAVAATRRDAEVLAVPPGSPLLRRCGLNTDEVGRPLLYLQRDAPQGRMRIVIGAHPPG